MKKINNILMALVTFAFTSCFILTPNKQVCKTPHYCYDDLDTSNISTYLRTDGYYTCDSVSYLMGIGNNVRFMFDGSYTCPYFSKAELPKEDVKPFMYNDDGCFQIKDGYLFAESFGLFAFTMEKRCYRFKLIDKETIILEKFEIYMKKALTPWASRSCKRVYHFVPFVDILQPRDYYKRKKWMWKNKENWKRYKQSLKKGGNYKDSWWL